MSGLSRIQQLQGGGEPPAASDATSPRVTAASASASASSDRSGWCLKKGKTDKPWAKAHHSMRYFNVRGTALCYFERSAKSPSDELGGTHLQGIIDLREVLRIRPSADATAPVCALDVVLRGRTYVIVPQPPTADEVSEWVRSWAPCVRPGGIASELRLAAGLPAEPDPASMRGSMAAADGDESDDGDGADGSGRPGAFSNWQPPEVVLQGYLHKMPVRSEANKGGLLTSVVQLGEIASWRRRYFQLRRGMLQWYRDDPGAGGEFLGVLRLTPDTTLELERGEARLRVTAAGEILLLRVDDAGEPLTRWHAELAAQVASVQKGSRRTEYAPPALPTLDLERQSETD